MKKLIVITGPSGAGLPDIVSEIFRLNSELASVIPITARKMKNGEKNGQSFWFYDLNAWNALRESGDLLEATELAGNDYGTSRKLVQEQLENGHHVLLSVEPERAAQVKRSMPESVCIYTEPADADVLRDRYAASARNSYELNARLELAREQREASGYSDFYVDSTDVQNAAVRILQIINSLE